MLTRKGQRGATAVEYALAVSLIAVVIIVAVALFGTNTNATYQCTNDSMAAQTNQCP